MKNIYSFILLAILIFSCSDPLPTEIGMNNISDDAQIDVEVLSPEPDLFVYESGYDTLGFVASAPPKKTIINISGIKNSYKNLTFKRTTAFAVYIDKNLKVVRPDGRVIGYGSKSIGETSFNNIKALPFPRTVKYKWNGILKDTTLGIAHVLSFQNGRNSLFPFPYGENIKFELNPIIGEKISLSIPSPQEIFGEVNISGSLKKRDLSITLNWNGDDEGKIEIVVGGMNPKLKNPYPLYKIRVRDNGKLRIPRSLIATFPFDRFRQIVFTFARQKFVGNPINSNKIIVAQSIHNIKVDVQ